MKFSSLPLYVKILAGMVLGILLGILSIQAGFAAQIDVWVKPFGEIFMRLLKFIAIPLVMISLVKGVGNLSDIASLSRIGIKTIGIYVCTTVLAVLVGLTLVELIGPGKMVSPDSAAAMQADYGTTVAEQNTQAEAMAETPPLQFLVDLFPDNLVGAMSDNGGMLQIIVIAILVGVAVLFAGKEKAAPFMNLIESLDAIVLKLIDIIMRYAPVGVLALMAGMIADTAGNLELLGALGLYVLTVILGLLLMIFLFYPLLLHLFSKIPVRKFLKTMPPVQLLAFTTSSSAATLPLNMETVEQKLGVSQRVTSFVLPMGMTINMDGTSLYQAVAAVFIAQVLGIELTWVQLLTIVATTTLSSIGTPGIPGGAVVILLMVLSSVGLPPEGLALILGLDRPLDMLRTVVNVTGDATVASIVDANVKD
ncbi:dicarboxylate/amino acid:cation symporter [Rikenella microfusus]|uniref:dicarboxylate/amino acid:cation symporter n=1 Tax=Rikenella microfusus TaxID=28139 RepID=UPI001D83FB32|nr:dicarboxylate/amino acid:cation symporter [Rikenella microfusus]HJE87724.1 dicarboxylate/amino acid:cation symporter [Rikenella microfusus]